MVRQFIEMMVDNYIKGVDCAGVDDVRMKMAIDGVIDIMSGVYSIIIYTNYG